MRDNKVFIHDILLISALLMVSMFLFMFQKTERKVGSFAVVAVNGVETDRFPLSKDASYIVNGGTNKIIIQNGSVSMLEAECPDKLCVKFGPIKYNGQCITCLPNKLTVTVTGADSSVELVI